MCEKLLNVKEHTERSFNLKSLLVSIYWRTLEYEDFCVSVYVHVFGLCVCVCVGHIGVVLCIKNTSQQAFHIPQGKNKGYSESRSQPALHSIALPCLKDTDKEKRRF